jgi:hypothetical protein
MPSSASCAASSTVFIPGRARLTTSHVSWRRRVSPRSSRCGYASSNSTLAPQAKESPSETTRRTPAGLGMARSRSRYAREFFGCIARRLVSTGA